MAGLGGAGRGFAAGLAEGRDGVRLTIRLLLPDDRLASPRRVTYVRHDLFLTPFGRIAETLGMSRSESLHQNVGEVGNPEF